MSIYDYADADMAEIHEEQMPELFGMEYASPLIADALEVFHGIITKEPPQYPRYVTPQELATHAGKNPAAYFADDGSDNGVAFHRRPRRDRFLEEAAILNAATEGTFDAELFNWHEGLHDSIGTMMAIARLYQDGPAYVQLTKMARSIGFKIEKYGFEDAAAMQITTLDEHKTAREVLIQRVNQVPKAYELSCAALAALLHADVDDSFIKDFVARAPHGYHTIDILDADVVREKAHSILTSLDPLKYSDLLEPDTATQIIEVAHLIKRLQTDRQQWLQHSNKLKKIVKEIGKGEEFYTDEAISRLRAIGIVLSHIDERNAASAIITKKKYYEGYKHIGINTYEVDRHVVNNAHTRGRYLRLNDTEWTALDPELKFGNFIGQFMQGDVATMKQRVSDLPEEYKLHGIFLTLFMEQYTGEHTERTRLTIQPTELTDHARMYDAYARIRTSVQDQSVRRGAQIILCDANATLAERAAALEEIAYAAY